MADTTSAAKPEVNPEDFVLLSTRIRKATHDALKTVVDSEKARAGIKKEFVVDEIVSIGLRQKKRSRK